MTMLLIVRIMREGVRLNLWCRENYIFENLRFGKNIGVKG